MALARRRAGFSIVEVLIAAGLMLFIALSILPLFTRSLINVRHGADSSEVANMNRASVEEFFQLDFNSPTLTLDAGSEKVVEEKYLQYSERWVPRSDPEIVADPAIWYRTTTVRQYGWGAVGELPSNPALLTVDPALALPAGTPSADVILKEIIVEIDRTADPGIFGDAELTLRMFKTY